MPVLKTLHCRRTLASIEQASSRTSRTLARRALGVTFEEWHAGPDRRWAKG